MKNLPLRMYVAISMLAFVDMLIGGGAILAQPASATSIISSVSAAKWPKSIRASDHAVLDIYQPQTESYTGNTLQWRSTISIQDSGSQDPVFGICAFSATVLTDTAARKALLDSIKLTYLHLATSTRLKKKAITALLENNLSPLMGVLSLDEILASLDQSREEQRLSSGLNHESPNLIFRNHPTMLVEIDGNPRLKRNVQWGLDAVVNTPFTIIKFNDKKFYLYGGNHWYVAPDAVGPYAWTNDRVNHRLRKIARKLEKTAQNNASMDDASADNASTDNASTDNASTDDVDEEAGSPVFDIVVSTVPAVLIQTDGDPAFSPIKGTGLLYVQNTNNDVFLDTLTQEYYILLSGRWYSGGAHSGDSPWQYVAPDRLPADFAKIPPGSARDNVLASVPGTKAAREAVMEAAMPQTAKIYREDAGTDVEYDGEPRFKGIEGTSLQYAVNTCATVLRSGGLFYVVDKGVWYTGVSAMGPWFVSDIRPDQLDLIPPSCPVYHAKYVQIYDAEPEYVLMGYTAGYLDSYVDDCYVPQPWSDDCAINWFDDCLGCSFGVGWDIGIVWGGWRGRGPGYWGRGGYAGGGGYAGRGGYAGGGRPWHDGRDWRNRWHWRGGYYGRTSTNDRQVHADIRSNGNIYRNREGMIPLRPATSERISGAAYASRSGSGMGLVGSHTGDRAGGAAGSRVSGNGGSGSRVSGNGGSGSRVSGSGAGSRTASNSGGGGRASSGGGGGGGAHVSSGGSSGGGGGGGGGGSHASSGGGGNSGGGSSSGSSGGGGGSAHH